MATVMSWSNSEGVKGRCDGRCHNAKGTKCRCMCGGRLHGKARDGTLLEVLDKHAKEIFDAARQRCKEKGFTLDTSKYEMPLFDR